jgi:hypothetical protein
MLQRHCLIEARLRLWRAGHGEVHLAERTGRYVWPVVTHVVILRSRYRRGDYQKAGECKRRSQPMPDHSALPRGHPCGQPRLYYFRWAKTADDVLTSVAHFCSRTPRCTDKLQRTSEKQY